MVNFAHILEEELKEAVEVTNKKSLHRYIVLLTENIAGKEENRMEHTEFQQELIKIEGRFNQMISEVREGFKHMDQRFITMQTSMDQRFGTMQTSMDHRFETIQQQMNRRFDASEKQFNRQTAMMSIGFLVITTLITIYRFLG